MSASHGSAEGSHVNGIRKKRPIRVFLLSVLVIILYFALFPYPLGRELVAKPVWAVDASSSPEAGAEEGQTAPFQLGGTFGYVTGDGRILYTARPLFRVALTDAGFINFSRLGTTWVFQDRRGEKKFAFSGQGYPLLSRDAGRLFTVKTDTTGLSELDSSGDVLWSKDFPCLVTSISIESDFLLLGLLNGALQLVDRHGGVTAEYDLRASRIPVILGCSISPDGSLAAAVSGIDPQYLMVLEIQGTSARLLSQIPLSSDFRREVRIAFSPDGRYLVFEGAGSAELYDPASHAVSSLPLPGGLQAFSFMPERDAAAFIGGTPAQRELLIVKPFASVISHESFPAGSVCLGRIGAGILLGIDHLLLRVDLEEM